MQAPSDEQIEVRPPNGHGRQGKQRKGRLGRSLGAQVDAAASAFPVTILSDRADGLQPSEPCPIMTDRMTKTAVFWDRDGTLIEDPGYLSDPTRVKLMPGAAEAIARLSQAGLENIICTNQSGIARGLFTEETLESIHARMRELLEAGGARVDAIYYCPFLDGPDAVVEAYRQDSDLRKPRPGMLAKASLERQIDLAASWAIGDSLRDAQAGRAAGCRTILVTSGGEAAPQRDRSIDFVAGSLTEAVDIVVKHTPGAMVEEPGTADQQTLVNGPSPSIDQATPVLHEILSFMRMVDRRQQSDDFSLGRLLGVIVQMIALAVLVWAVFGMIRDEQYGTQIVRFLFALVLQAMAATFLLLSSRK